jgi:hypothetical protein
MFQILKKRRKRKLTFQTYASKILMQTLQLLFNLSKKILISNTFIYNIYRPYPLKHALSQSTSPNKIIPLRPIPVGMNFQGISPGPGSASCSPFG